MQAKIDLKPFKDATNLMSSVIERRNTIPILSTVKVTVGEGKVRFQGTNLDQTIRTTIEATDTRKGQVCIELAKLQAIAAASDGSIELTSEDDPENRERILKITANPIVMRIRDMHPVEDYPTHLFWLENSEFSKEAETITTNQDDLLRILNLGRHCISKEETRYYLNGTYLCKKPGTNALRAVTTDGHRMAIIDSPIEASGHDVGAILPANMVDFLRTALKKGGNQPAQIGITTRHVSAKIDETEFSSKLIDGRYPDYLRAIPSAEPKASVTLNKAGVSRMLAACSADRQRSLPMLLDCTKGIARHRTLDRDVIEMPIQATGDLSLGINFRFLAAQANATPTFTLSAASASDPMMIKSDDPNASFIVMPQQVR